MTSEKYAIIVFIAPVASKYSIVIKGLFISFTTLSIRAICCVVKGGHVISIVFFILIIVPTISPTQFLPVFLLQILFLPIVKPSYLGVGISMR